MPCCCHLRDVLGQVAAAEDAAMDLRHQRLHAAVEDLREAGVVGDLLHRHAGLAQRAGGAAGGEDLARRCAASAWANGTRPVLSETEISARRMGTMSGMGWLGPDGGGIHRPNVERGLSGYLRAG